MREVAMPLPLPLHKTSEVFPRSSNLTWSIAPRSPCVNAKERLKVQRKSVGDFCQRSRWMTIQRYGTADCHPARARPTVLRYPQSLRGDGTCRPVRCRKGRSLYRSLVRHLTGLTCYLTMTAHRRASTVLDCGLVCLTAVPPPNLSLVR